MAILIRPFETSDVDQIIGLSMRAWEPVFKELKPADLGYVYEAFYPEGWQVRQSAEIAHLLASEGGNVFVACNDGNVVGFVGIRLHPADNMGEIHILTVDPSFQRQGCASALIGFAMNKLHQAGMDIVMAETGDDPGHATSRATYESAGFKRWPVARYFRKL